MEKIYKLTQAELAQELIEVRLDRGVSTTKKEALEMVKDVYEVIENVLQQENVGITLGRAGVLYNGLQKERTVRHPQTKDEMTVPALRTLKFKKAPKFKSLLNE